MAAISQAKKKTIKERKGGKTPSTSPLKSVFNCPSSLVLLTSKMAGLHYSKKKKNHRSEGQNIPALQAIMSHAKDIEKMLR